MDKPDIVKLCKDCSSCPSVEFAGENVIIKDDYEGTVRMTKEQADMLGDEIARRKTTKTARG